MLSSSRSFLFAFVILLVAAGSVFKIADLDFWWHLKTGQIIVQQKAFQHSEIYSFTAAGREYVDHEWLFQVIAYLAYAAAGTAGVIFLKTGLLVLIYLLAVHHLLQKGCSPWLAAGIILISVCGGVQRFIERPEIFSILYLVLIYLAIDAFLNKEEPLTLAFVPVIIILWANTHAAVILGLVLQAIVIAGLLMESVLQKTGQPTYYRPNARKILTLTVLLAISFAATLINPYGFRLLKVPFELTAIIDSGLLNNQEWQRTSPAQLPLFYLCLVLTLAAHALNFRRISWIHLALTAFFGFIAIKYVRNAGIFAVLVPFLIAPYALKLSEKRVAVQFVTGAMLLLAFGVLAFSFPFERGIGISSGFPEKIAGFTVNRNLQGNMLNSYGFGGYLIWKLYPERKIFIDGRNEVYLPLLKKIVASRTDSRLWKKLLDDYAIEYALLNYVDDLEKVTLLDQKNQARVAFMPFSSTHFPRIRWALIYFDDTGMVLVRRNGKNSTLQSLEYTSVFPEGRGYQQTLAHDGKVDSQKAIVELQRKLKEDPSCTRAQRLLSDMQTK